MSHTKTDTDRRTRLSLLAKAPHQALLDLWHGYAPQPAFTELRPPEIGAVMVRGRAGAVGAPFNLGEMTVTRCSVRLSESGAVGHGTVQGRSHEAARAVAMIDALAEAGQLEALEAQILSPLRDAAEAQTKTRADKAAATKVEFFTMVRGED